MKVVVVDNFGREGPGAVEQKVIAGPGLSYDESQQIAEEFNAQFDEQMTFYYYRVVEDDYVLAEPWEP